MEFITYNLKHTAQKGKTKTKQKFCVLSFTFYEKRGFVALFAVLVSSIVLTITMGLLNIALKETILASSGRESQFGFYAADTGAECALYHDIKSNNGEGVFPNPGSAFIGSGYFCNGYDITVPRTVGGFSSPSFLQAAPTTTTEFWLPVGSSEGCTKVNVSKDTNGKTKIEASGYNTCDFSDPRVIERGIRVNY